MSKPTYDQGITSQRNKNTSQSVTLIHMFVIAGQTKAISDYIFCVVLGQPLLSRGINYCSIKILVRSILF